MRSSLSMFLKRCKFLERWHETIIHEAKLEAIVAAQLKREDRLAQASRTLTNDGDLASPLPPS